MRSQTNSNDLKKERMENEQVQPIDNLTEVVANVGLAEDQTSTLCSDNGSISNSDNDDNTYSTQYNRIAITLYANDDSSTVYDGASVLDDNTVYDGASILTDTASTLFDDDTSTLIGGNKKEKKSKASNVNYLTEEDLPNLRVIASGLNVKNRGSKELLYITLSVRQFLRRDSDDIINNRDRELWQIEKSYNDFLKLDNTFRDLGYINQQWPVFDKNLFLSHNPEKVIKRRAQIDQYFRILLATIPSKDSSPICQFLNSGIVQYQKNFGNTIKEGYLARKEGMFNVWKSRYCVLKGTTFQIYETSAGGSPIDSIPLQRSMFATLKFNQLFHPLQYGFSIMQFKKDRPGFPLYTHHELWPTSNNEENERNDWEKELNQAASVIAIQDNSVVTAKEEIKEEKYLKAKKSYQAMRKAQAIEAKQLKKAENSINNNNNSLLKKLSEKR